MLGTTAAGIQADRLAAAREIALRSNAAVILKGSGSVIAGPDGSILINPSGNAGLATAGSGDVLTGMLAALLAQLLDSSTACQLAVYLHGAAGELAEADEGEMSMLAGDIVSHIGDAVQELTARERTAPGAGE